MRISDWSSDVCSSDLLLTRFVFSVFKKVLPEMSSTEREVLESGDVWWEAEMFRGRPDWERLLSFKYTKLTPEEQSFLDNECEALCKLCDDWKIEYEDKYLPKSAWDYIREKRFFSMLIKKDYGGLGFSANAQSAESGRARCRARGCQAGRITGG